MSAAQNAKVPLEASRLMAEAETATGLSNWGSDRTFEVGLTKLLDAVEATPYADLTRGAMEAHAVGLLTTRLRLEEDARQHPTILLGEIERPLIVTGMPRTGTTWLFELLALDPANRAPLDWEVQAPWPAPEAETYATDPRIAEANARYAAMLERVPELATMHNYTALLPQECNAINTLHFASADFWAVYGLPDYLHWITHDKPEGGFITHRRVLQQLQWKGPKGRWTLKSPPYLLMLDELDEAYPDACLVQTHREPSRIVASLASMIRAIRRANFGDIPELTDPKAIARGVLEHFGHALEKGTRHRQNPVADGRFLDIAYRDIVNTPMETLHRIYTRFDLPWTDVFERRLRDHLAKGRDTGHGKHKYDPVEYGIPELCLDEQFPEYRARFGDLLSD